MRISVLLWGCLFFLACRQPAPVPESSVSLMVLGVAQDAGFPQAGCDLECCSKAWKDARYSRMVSCLGVADHESKQHWIFDATPDFPKQVKMMQTYFEGSLSGVWLTHAHIGHYTGLMHLGHEVMGAQSMPVYAMPRMEDYLRNNGPWSQLVTKSNIELKALNHNQSVTLNPRLSVTPLQVPHRDEFSETVGFRIQGPEHKALFIPDIDKWHLWDLDLADEVKAVDWVFIDGTFYADGELPNRDMSKILHPFVSESMELLAPLSATEKAKVHFIHLNHTNPLLSEDSDAYQQVIKLGFKVAQQGQIFSL